MIADTHALCQQMIAARLTLPHRWPACLSVCPSVRLSVSVERCLDASSMSDHNTRPPCDSGEQLARQHGWSRVGGRDDLCGPMQCCYRRPPASNVPQCCAASHILHPFPIPSTPSPPCLLLHLSQIGMLHASLNASLIASNYTRHLHSLKCYKNKNS